MSNFLKPEWQIFSYWNEKILAAIVISNGDNRIELPFQSWKSNRQQAELKAKQISYCDEMVAILKAFENVDTVGDFKKIMSKNKELLKKIS